MNNYRILIADDEHIICNALKKNLEKHSSDYHVTAVYSGEDALEALSADHFDLLITDIMMPGISGIELMKRASELYSEMKVIVITGEGKMETAIEALRLGAENFLLKPVSIESLFHAVKKAREHQRLSQELKVSEEKFRNTFNYSALGIILINENWKILEFNNVVSKLTGYIENELSVKPFHEFITDEHKPKLRSKVDFLLQKQDDSFQLEVQLIDKYNKKKWIHLTGSVIPSSNSSKNIILQLIDISKKMETEKALVSASTKFEHVLDSIDAFVYVADMQTYEVLFINSYGRKVYGDVVGMTCWKTIYEGKTGPCEFCMFQELVDKNNESTGVVSKEYYHPKLKKWMLVRYRSIHWDDGRMVRLEVATDISDIKKAEKAMVDSEERFREIVEYSPFPIAVLSQNDKLIFLNPRFTDVFGYKADDIPTFDDWLQKAYPDESQRAEIKRNWKLIGSMQHKIEPKPFTTSLIAKDGEKHVVNFRVFTLSDDAKYVVYEDITGRKTAENALVHQQTLLEAVANASNSLLIQADSQNAIHSSLRTLGKILDLDFISIFLNRVVEKTLTMNPRYEWKKDNRKSLMKKTELSELPYTRFMKSISMRLSEGNIFAIKDTNTQGVSDEFFSLLQVKSLLLIPIIVKGSFRGLLLLGTEKPDVEWSGQEPGLLSAFAAGLGYAFEHERNRRELINARDAADSANRAKSEFLANMSHELRTPLNGILGYAQILSDSENLTKSQLEQLRIIENSGQHLLELINDILDLSKIEANKMEIVSIPFNLPEAMNSIAAMIRIRAEKKGLQFKYETTGELPEVVVSDEKRLTQVLLNLLGNSVKFTNEGTVRLLVSQRGSVTRFQVDDTGVGIPKDKLEEIFSPFKQVNPVESKSEGTGLGLAISRRLVSYIGGKLNVKSELGKGSSFYFEIAFNESEDGAVKKKPSEKQAIVGFGGTKQKALIVDDKIENTTFLSIVIKRFGFEPVTANNAKDGLAIIEKEKPALVLMDMKMPDMSGIEATKYIRENLGMKDIIVVAVSASVYKESIQESLDAGCNAFVSKPVKIEALQKVIQEHLNLDWKYKSAAKATEREEKPKEPLVLPPMDHLRKIYDLAVQGDIEDIGKELAEIDSLDKKFNTFTEEIRSLTKLFQLKKIRKMIKDYAKGEL